MANAATTKTAPILIERAAETGKKEFLQAALTSGKRIRKDDVIAAIDVYLAKAYNKDTAQQDIATWLADSAHASAVWARRKAKQWFSQQVQEYPPSQDYWWRLPRFARNALSMGAISPSELREIARSAKELSRNNFGLFPGKRRAKIRSYSWTSPKNKGLMTDLLKEAENWKE